MRRGASRQRTIYLNVSYVGQRVTGQQRYASSVVAHLPATWPRIGPPAALTRSRVAAWLWVLLVLPWRTRDGVLVSLTARAPLWHPRHVLVIHDLFAIEHPEWYSRTYHLTHAPLLVFQLRSAARLLAVSEPVARQLESMGHGPVAVAPNAPSPVFRADEVSGTDLGDDGHEWVPGDQQTVLGLGLEPGRYFVAVGSLEPRKNLRALAAAYARLATSAGARWPLVIVGATAEVFRQERVDWPDGACALGYVDDDMLRALYRHCGAVVLVSLAEGFGLPIVEARAAGAPRLVLSDIEVFRWVGGDGPEYVDAEDVAAIAAGLRRVMDEPCLPAREDLRFSWRRSAAVVTATASGAGDGGASQWGAQAGPRDHLAEAGVPSGASRGAIAVVVASAGRAGVLRELLDSLERQTVGYELVVSVPDEDSIPAELPDGTTLVVGTRGLTAQRNAGLEQVTDAEYFFFFDDDAVVRPDYLARGVSFFDAHPEVVALTGRVLLDGATGDEVELGEAEGALVASAQEPTSGSWRIHRELYGCNFAYRASTSPGIRFDERLPLYSWLEDHDFARRLLRHGLIASVDDCVIVHRGVKSGGRTSHRRLGYSQVMNPLYLMRKGSFPLWLTVHETVFRCGKNVVRSLHGPEREWRQQRLRGNAMAVADVLRGRLTPERITEL